MRKIGIRLFVMSVISFGAVTMLSASTSPVYHERIMHIRYMPEEPVVRVLLAKEKEGLNVEVKGAHNIYDPYTGKKLEAAFVGSSYYMSPTSNGIRWGQEFPGIYQLLIVPDDQSIGINVNGTVYPGIVAFYEVDGKLAAVNWLSLDDFTASLMSTNFLPKETDQKESLAAYAIALRSRVYQQLEDSQNTYWDVSAEDCGYQGRSVVRIDTPFVEALKGSRKIVMSQLHQSVVHGMRFDKKSIDDIRAHMPIADVQAMAVAGKDARVIINKFYPDHALSIAEKRPPQNRPVE